MKWFRRNGEAEIRLRCVPGTAQLVLGVLLLLQSIHAWMLCRPPPLYSSGTEYAMELANACIDHEDCPVSGPHSL